MVITLVSVDHTSEGESMSGVVFLWYHCQGCDQNHMIWWCNLQDIQVNIAKLLGIIGIRSTWYQPVQFQI
ncbi:hypothetical protein [Moorena sp. SIO3H5]|uniref:hypothetical protein n=1 Tax=Moorena sp. SIO3H5 TaxID=2607834 RepID=UPI0013B88724|nr:hypothetical protein [Moorena sp. SIO3H5]NEO69262.1 hypothetical protein [Moorena sp. SIO3H5]